MDIFFVVHVDDRILTAVDRHLKPFEVGGANAPTSEKVQDVSTQRGLWSNLLLSSL